MSQTEVLSSLASLPSPLPPTPEVEVFTREQWDILFSIMGVFVPSISVSSDEKNSAISPAELDQAVSKLKQYLPEGSSEDVVKDYLAESIVPEPAFREHVARQFTLFIPPSGVKGLGFVLSALNTTVGSYLLTGYSSPIHTQDLLTRTSIVCNWAHSRLPPLRAVFRSVSGLARQSWIATSLQIPRVIGFPPTPKHIERNPSYAFKFHDFTSPATPASLTTDVIIIGSGCGAGVTASHLSRAGLKCLVLEKSYHFPSTHFPMSPNEGKEHLMENGGFVASDDGSIVVLAGSTFGGGGTVNWSASLQPQYAVREEWAASGLPHFTGVEFQDCLDTVCERMGVAKATDLESLRKIEHNFTNSMLLEGARRLGMNVEVVPQNTASKRHFCGYCTYGCASTTKQGPANCWLPDAAVHGTEFVEGAFVEEIVFETIDGRKTAAGVKATWTSRDRQTTRSLAISAKRIIVAAGALNSPLVLLRSGLINPHIGANLHLHPTSTIWSVWPQRTNPWEGSILTVAVTSLEDQDGAHHGPKIEAICSTPAFGIANLPFRVPATRTQKPILSSALDLRLNAAKHGHGAGFISITRDADSGRVYFDPSDPTRRRVRIAYTPSSRDLRHLLAGQLAAARIQFVMGASEIDTCHPGGERWVRPSSVSVAVNTSTDVDVDEESFCRWLASIRARGLTSPDPCMVGSAHQMGTCRMSSSSKNGVVDKHGKVWDIDGLYVADASVCPSATGVNPMITTMGIAEWISRGIVKEIKRDKNQGD
ncbi:uncharacterized protein Z518_02570 [Rhinocladiella mackenziei CBS 650.93]|uniref:Long-chain-alcohol oxidase n=1 Tax=Rhinocladiella mackenziei CBS 650.93 TaxID=1442369 RepID=A0A0D2IX31_9EURO|nr:uncharacterized protein Z518_02570 [Rhinocladiella mackenziei CBS 650.93]KIX07916.1 hypothetical protein Z518_02570 [Rhinocladiella mackenziei CBS 650.93]